MPGTDRPQLGSHPFSSIQRDHSHLRLFGLDSKRRRKKKKTKKSSAAAKKVWGLEEVREEVEGSEEGRASNSPTEATITQSALF